jgi:hypothetical protein
MIPRWALAAAIALGALAGVTGQGRPAEPAGLTVVLLLDVTASVTRQPLPIDPRYAQVFNAFLQGLKPADRGAVGVIAGRTRMGPITGDHRALSASVRALLQVPDADRLGPSPLWDAVDEAVTEAAGDPSGRPAVVLFSDGKSSANVRGLDDVIENATRLHVSVHAVVEGPGSAFLAQSTQALDPAALVGRLTTATGGLRLLDRPADPRQRNPGPMVAQIMDALHVQR